MSIDTSSRANPPDGPALTRKTLLEWLESGASGVVPAIAYHSLHKAIELLEVAEKGLQHLCQCCPSNNTSYCMDCPGGVRDEIDKLLSGELMTNWQNGWKP